jgi:hypothetical protein
MIELEGYSGQLNDLQARGLITSAMPTIRLTELGRQIAESLPEKWQSAI